MCPLCDRDLAAEAGLAEDSTIEDVLAANVNVPRCRQCKTVICMQCAAQWEKKSCPYCRCSNYLDEYVFQMSQMRAAGFDDELRNLQALKACSGNVHEAIAIVLAAQAKAEFE